MNKKITYRTLSTGNYLGRFGRYYIFIRKRKHYVLEGFEKFRQWYTAYIGINGEWLYAEGIFGSSLSNIKKAKNWVREKLDKIP